MKIFEIANLLYEPKDKKLGEMFFLSKTRLRKRLNHNPKEPKGKAEDGSYCPKEKAGQSWSHIKDTKKEEDNEEEVA